MVYWVFMNPETRQVIKNDKLSNAVNSMKVGQKTTKVCPGVWIPVLDYKDNNFSHLWVFWNENQGVVAPMCAYVNEIQAQNFWSKQKKFNQEWNTSNKIQDMAPSNISVMPFTSNIKMKKVLV